MSVTREEVERIAALARLEMGEDEAESLRKDLSGILEHVETLGQAGRVDRSIPTAAHRSGAAPFREDGEVAPDRLMRGLDELAPRWEEGFFTVPRLPGLDEEGTP